eukprot:9488038-Pyramimonas_sp.AAC.1
MLDWDTAAAQLRSAKLQRGTNAERSIPDQENALSQAIWIGARGQHEVKYPCRDSILEFSTHMFVQRPLEVNITC